MILSHSDLMDDIIKYTRWGEKKWKKKLL
jgi:hypothetical protein